jgi:hypothetical protein
MAYQPTLRTRLIGYPPPRTITWMQKATLEIRHERRLEVFTLKNPTLVAELHNNDRRKQSSS